MIPVSVIVADRFIAELFKRPQKITLHRLGLPRFWPDPHPDIFAFLEIVHCSTSATD